MSIVTLQIVARDTDYARECSTNAARQQLEFDRDHANNFNRKNS